MRCLLIVPALVLITGCWETAPVVRVPVPVPCIKSRPVRPVLVTEAELVTMSDYQVVLALEQHRLRATGYIGELEAAVNACAALPSPAASGPSR
jgi:hypothetical protein